jgi:glutathione S-transferase
MAAPKIQLYLDPGACSFASHILLHETGVPFTSNVIPTRGGFPKDKLHLNPKGVVPILILDGETITESPAILTAIAQLAPTKHLLGRTNLDVVRCYEWMNFISGKLHGQAFGGLFRPARYVDNADLYDDVRGKARSTVRECYDHIEDKLRGREWAVGEAFTAVDAYLLVFYRWGTHAGCDMKEYPNYAKLAKRVAEREATIKAAEAEGIDVLTD